jgi:hypothetical protein
LPVGRVEVFKRPPADGFNPFTVDEIPIQFGGSHNSILLESPRRKEMKAWRAEFGYPSDKIGNYSRGQGRLQQQAIDSLNH